MAAGSGALAAGGGPRCSQRTAEPRALLYAFFSRLTASPFDREESVRAFLFEDGAAESLGGICRALPYSVDCQALEEALRALRPEAWADLRRAYSGAFEVGNDGPVAPLRAELVRVADSKMKEELIRFYDFFSYELREGFAWAPDHISILLEFMQLLCLKEMSGDQDESLSSQRAQLDFLDRHIVNWLPVSVGKLVQHSPEGFYTSVMTTLWRFLEQDRSWNAQSVVPYQEDE